LIFAPILVKEKRKKKYPVKSGSFFGLFFSLYAEKTILPSDIFYHSKRINQLLIFI